MTDLKETKLGHVFTHPELITLFHQIFGGIAFPSKREGFAVVIGMAQPTHFNDCRIYLLDIFESFDLCELIRWCGAADFRYSPNRWIGDQNDAACKFIDEINSGRKEQTDRRFSITPTLILGMNNLYSYILRQIKEMLSHNQLFLKDSKIKNYLMEIQESEIAEIQIGSYPGIEALAFSVLELREYIRIQKAIASQPQQRHEEPKNILTRGLKIH